MEQTHRNVVFLSISCSIFDDVRRASGGAATRLIIASIAGVERVVCEGKAGGRSSMLPPQELRCLRFRLIPYRRRCLMLRR